MRTIQITLGAAATRVTASRIVSPFITIQNNAAHSIRIGDNTVSATKGIFIPATAAAGAGSGSLTVQRADNNILLSNYYVFGTAGDVVDIIYE